jgi:hypothetical protein
MSAPAPATLSIQIPVAPASRSRSWNEIPTPMAPRAGASRATASASVETPLPVHRNTYLAEYCYECDNEFNFLRIDEYVVNDHAFCSRRCFNRFQNALCDVCERHPCACQDDVSTISDASSTTVSEDDSEDDNYDLIVREDQLPVNLAFIDFDTEDTPESEEQELDYENYDEDDCENPDDEVAPWRP